ncbi:MAG: PAS domain S-box protein [Gemmatimonadales bacterium]|nr:PAS domain S-box protein [Gemmatimonadales bacterium]
MTITPGGSGLPDERVFSEAMVASLPGILYCYDEQGRFLRWNRSFEVASGYSADQITRMHPLDFFSERDRPLLERRIAEVFASGGSAIEADFIARDGTATPYLFTGRRVVLEGKPCLVGVGIDISERKRAQDRLAESERRYRELVEHANSIILRWNADGRITLLNEYGQRFFGFSADEILGRHVIGTIVPTTESGGRDLRRLIEDICSAPESYEQSVNENMLRNGDRVWIAWTNRIIRDAEGRLVEFLSIGTDITARRRAEEAQRASEARYRTLFEYAPDGILIADPESRYLDANPSICRMLGYARHELIGKLPVDILPPAELRRVAGTLSEIRDVGAHNQEWTFLRKDGSTFPADVIAAGTPDGNLIAVVRDVTERKAADAEREKRHRAEAADRIKSAFLATMSHELRTPLNSIIGFTGIMLQGLAGPVNPEQHKQLDMVRRSARHLLALVNDVLDISKIEAGQLDVAREPFDLGRSVAKVVASVAPQAEAKGLALVSEVAADLGTILGDERRVEQILLNLLGNAIKFTERGQVSVIAELADAPHPEAGGPVVRIRVADTGPGIRTEDLASLFQPFRQLDVGMARRHDGTGLGLAICRRLASLMGGDVVAESEWGVGSVFTVTLPLRSQESS